MPARWARTNPAVTPVGLRRAKRRANNLHPVGSKHGVKSVGEFLVAIANQETDVLGAPGVDVHPAHRWLTRAQATDIHALHRFVRTLPAGSPRGRRRGHGAVE